MLGSFAKTIFERTYAHDTAEGKETWEQTAHRVTKHVMRAVGVDMRNSLAKEIREAIVSRKFIPAGRYLYASGRPMHQICNCLLLRAHDSREGWSELMAKASKALMTGAGIGVNYSDIRHEGALIRKSGGTASGPIPLMQMVNECGRGVMQGGVRRCLPGDAPVIMSDLSRKSIMDIKPGEYVYTRFGPKLVKATSCEGRQKLLKITTTRGSVICSHNHRWLGATKMRIPKWLTAKDIKPGWKLYFHSAPHIGGERKDLNWMYTLGYFLANGCAYSSNRTHEVTFQLPSNSVTEEQKNTIHKGMARFNIKGHERPGHGACVELRFRSKDLVPVFQEYKLPHHSFVVPKEVFDGDIESRSAFIAGWADADGSLHENSKVRVANIHPETRESLIALFETLGFSMKESRYEVYFSAYQAELYNATIGKYTHRLKLPDNGYNKVPAKVLNVTDYGEGITYDIEVEDKHEFIAYDHVSHNSAIWAGLNWKHPDIYKFITIKNWPDEIHALKTKDFSFPATLDHTNVSVGLDDDFFEAYNDDEHPQHALAHSVYWAVIEQMLRTGEPGFYIDVGKDAGENLRNAPLSASTWVLTAEGYQQISALIDKKSVLWTGTRWAPNCVFTKTKENAQTIKIEITGKRTIISDPEHEFFVERYEGKGERRKLKGVEKIAASDLQRGDILHTSLPQIVSPENRDEYIRGFIFGDGSVNGVRSEVTLCCDEKKELLPYLQNDFVQRINPETSRGYIRIYYKGANHSKAYPSLDTSKIASWLAGLFDADGSYSEDRNSVRLSQPYEILVNVRRDLERIGIRSTITRAGKSGYTGKQCWLLNILASDVGLFSLRVPTKRLKIQNFHPYRDSHIKVLKVGEGPIEDVFCCDVHVEEHSFVAEGVVVSNCTEITSRESDDICDLGSINLSKIDSLDDFKKTADLGIAFLLAGSVYTDVPYTDVDKVLSKNRRLGLGLMGIHEWLLKRGKQYGPDEELGRWLKAYSKSGKYANKWADEWGLRHPKKTRAIAPTGTTSIVAETTGGVEPVFCVAYKRRYMKGNQHCYQYVIDPCAKRLIEEGIDPHSIEDAYMLARNVERRVAFQAWVQQFVDHAISSTINLPAWGSEFNNKDLVRPFGAMLIRYLPQLRGVTAYPDGSRGGQPLNPVSYKEASEQEGVEIVEEQQNVCSLTGGSCGD